MRICCLRTIPLVAVVALKFMLANSALAQVQQQQQPGQLQQRPNQTQRPGQLQQQPGQQQPGQQGQQPQAGNQANMTDAQLVACLLIDNQNEVAVAKIAEQQSENDEVKKFAKQMIEDHSKFIEKLRPMAGNYANVGTQQGNTDRGQATTRQTSGGQINLVELKQRLGQKCLESARKELESKQGAKFDHCYTGMQVGEHMKMLDTLVVFQEYASPQLRSILEEGQKTTEEHLEHAKQLMEKLENGRERAQASREDRTSRTQ